MRRSTHAPKELSETVKVRLLTLIVNHALQGCTAPALVWTCQAAAAVQAISASKVPLLPRQQTKNTWAHAQLDISVSKALLSQKVVQLARTAPSVDYNRLNSALSAHLVSTAAAQG